MAQSLHKPVPPAPACLVSGGSANPRFEKFAWGVLGWNLIVVLWGAFVRATGSGAGCGSHWPLCNGEVIPPTEEMKTLIEFTHRVTSGVALIAVVALLVWAFRAFPKKHLVRGFAVASLVLILVEALLGAGLVLLQYVEQNASVGRAIYLSAHLANTQLLLSALALAAWFARADNQARPFTLGFGTRLGMLLPVTLVVGISGAIAALGDTLFPATSFAAGVQQEMESTAHFLLRLRVFHPALAILGAVYVCFAALFVIKTKPSCESRTLAWAVWALVFVQLLAGAVNVWLLAPVWMQLVHLLLADFLWVLLTLMVVEAAGSAKLKQV